MSHLPPPPPSATQYAPPPPTYGQQYQYSPQDGYQQPPPLGANYQNGYHHRSPPPGHHQHTGHDRPQKSKMIVTRYPRPPNQQQQYPGPSPPGPYNHAPPPPPAAQYQQSGWNQHSAHPPPNSNYPPPPNYTPPPPAASRYPAPPPHQQQASHSGYGPQPGPKYPPPPSQNYLPPPPSHASSTAQGYPPPPPAALGSWNAPPPKYPPQVAYSPAPTTASYRAPPAPPTPAQAIVSVPPPQPTPTPQTVFKDRNDPGFYDGWDDEEFEYAGAFWIPSKGDTSHDALSIGQYIWHPAAQATRAVSSNIDEIIPVASVQQKYDPAHFVVSSKYFETEDDEGHEYVYTFQRIRDVDAWKDRKDDPLFKEFKDAELHEYVVPADEVFQQVLSRPKEDDRNEVTAELVANLGAYLNGTKGGTGKNVEAENVLAALGVTGMAKPVFATPFPAYNPPPEEAPKLALSRPPHHVKREQFDPTSQRDSFNPFKISNNTLRQSTPRSTSFVHHQPVAAASPAHRPPPRSASHSYHGSPLDRSPSHHQPTPPQAALYPPQPPTIYQPSRPAPPSQHSPPSGFGQYAANHRSRLSPSHDYGRSPTESPYQDPWRASNGHREITPAGQGTPIGSDFGDHSTNGQETGSVPRTPVDGQDHRKRRLDDPEPQHRKRSKPQIDAAYQRRW